MARKIRTSEESDLVADISPVQASNSSSVVHQSSPPSGPAKNTRATLLRTPGKKLAAGLEPPKKKRKISRQKIIDPSDNVSTDAQQSSDEKPTAEEPVIIETPAAPEKEKKSRISISGCLYFILFMAVYFSIILFETPSRPRDIFFSQMAAINDRICDSLKDISCQILEFGVQLKKWTPTCDIRALLEQFHPSVRVLQQNIGPNHA